MSDLLFITNHEADVLKTNYETSLDSTSDIKSWFWAQASSVLSQSPQNPLRFFKIRFPDFTKLLAFPGATKVRLYFGLEDFYEPNSGSQLVVLIRMTDGVPVNDIYPIDSGYYKLTNRVYLDVSNMSAPSAQWTPGAMSPTIEAALFENYLAYFKVNPAIVPPDFCKIQVNGMVPPLQPLTSYSYDMKEIHATLFGNPNFTAPLHFCVLQVHLINYYNPLPGGEPQSEEPVKSTIGVILQMSVEIGSFDFLRVNGTDNYLPLSSYYDFSAPCPPTCPVS